jgi:hypothetical protein
MVLLLEKMYVQDASDQEKSRERYNVGLKCEAIRIFYFFENLLKALVHFQEV